MALVQMEAIDGEVAELKRIELCDGLPDWLKRNWLRDPGKSEVGSVVPLLARDSERFENVFGGGSFFLLGRVDG